MKTNIAQQVTSTSKKITWMRDILFIIIGGVYFYITQIADIRFGKQFLETSLGNTIFNSISVVIFFILILGVLGIINLILHKLLDKITKSTKNTIDDLVGKESLWFLNKLKYLISFYGIFYFIDFGEKVSSYMDQVFLTIFIFLIIILLSNLFSIFFDHVVIKNRKFRFLNKSLSTITKKSVIICIWIFGIITILSNLGFNVTALIAGAGIGGLAFAFAAQKSIANIFGAITILLNKPFRIGDFVNINGITGTVKDLGLTYISLIEENGHQVMIPNEVIISTNVENYSIRESRRSEFSIGLVYGTSLESMKKGIEIIETILESYKTSGEIGEYRVNFDMFGDFSLNIQVTYFSLITDSYLSFLKQKEQVNLQIKKEFEKEKLDMAFPTQELILQQPD